MKLKPIEPGCLAMHVSKYSENNKVVRVGRRLGKIKSKHGGDWVGIRWEVDQLLRSYDIYSCGRTEATDRYHRHAGEHQLIRIDGDSFEEETREEAQELQR